MIFTKPWGFEDKICGHGRRLVMNEQFCTSVHRHEVDEILSLDSGFVALLHGDKVSPSHIFAEDNARLFVPANTWHRIVALKDSVLTDFSNREDGDVERDRNGGRVSDEEFRALLANYLRGQGADRMMTAEMAGIIAGSVRDTGRKIGFCNGCFDLMHLGHVELLRQARMRCDCLFVGVNTDMSVRRIKGENRPFVDEMGRFAMVEACRFVDYVVEAPDETCVELVRNIKPDVYVTTTEYGKDGPEAKQVVAQGGSVEVVPMLNGYNTTKLAMSVSSRRR